MLLGLMEFWFDPLRIDQFRSLCVPAIVGRQKISIHEHGRDQAGIIGGVVKVPENIEDFYIPGTIGSHPVRRDQLGNGIARVNREVCRLQEVRQLFGGDLTSPVCIVPVDIGLVKSLWVPLKSAWIEFRAQRGGIVRHPFLEHAFWIEKISLCPGFKAKESARFEVFHDRADRSERHSCCRRDFPVVGSNQFRTAEQGERNV